MSEENRIRFAGLMEEYLNIPAFVCEFIEKQLKDNKYKEVVEYVVQRRNEIENKKDYLTEQEKINQYLDLQQKVEQLEGQLEEKTYLYNKLQTESKYAILQLENIRKEAIEWIEHNQYYFPKPYDLLNILNKGSDKE